MTSQLFEKYVRGLDRNLKTKKGFILDDCPVYWKCIPGRSHINLFYLPSNTTSKPMEAGIIHRLKGNYRSRMGRERMFSVENLVYMFSVQNIGVENIWMRIVNEKLAPSVLQFDDYVSVDEMTNRPCWAFLENLSRSVSQFSLRICKDLCRAFQISVELMTEASLKKTSICVFNGGKLCYQSGT